MLWTDGSVLFLFGKGGSAVLANCSLCGTEATLFFSAGPVCSSFSAEACVILHALGGLGSTNKSAISLLFFYNLTLVLFSPPCPLLHLSSYLKLCGRSGRNCLLSRHILSDYNGSPDTRFSRGTTRLMSWPDGESYLRPLQSPVVSLSYLSYPLLSFLGLDAYCLIEDFLNFHRGIVFPRHARCVLSRLRCNRHSLLLCSYLSRIDRIDNPLVPGHLLSHSALSSYGLFARSLFGDSLCL